MQFCLSQTTNTTCLANSGTIHMCTTTSTGGCVSVRGHYEPVLCLVDYLRANTAGANASLANGTAPCELAARIFRPCYDYTNQSACTAVSDCTWNAANPNGINYDTCITNDPIALKDAALAELNATSVPAIKAQDSICQRYTPADGCQPPVIALYQQCGGAGADCAR
jgi:hypothetical protein